MKRVESRGTNGHTKKVAQMLKVGGGSGRQREIASNYGNGAKIIIIIIKLAAAGADF